MRRGSFLLWLAVGAILALPATVHAQFAGEASLIGTVTDTTGGALPGVLVQAVHVDTGNTFETVTDGTGGYRLPVRIGGYEVTATLAGFGTVTDAIALLYGTESVVDFQMSVGGRGRDGDSDRGSTVARSHLVERRRQRRCAPDAGATGQWPQLDRSGDASAGRPGQLHR